MHKIIRIPPNDRKGRVHTSFITISAEEPLDEVVLPTYSQVKFEYSKSQGKGGQNVNKRETCVTATYGRWSVRIQDQRTQEKNKEKAYQTLLNKIKIDLELEINSNQAKLVKNQIGLGKRSGEVVRIYNFYQGFIKEQGSSYKLKSWEPNLPLKSGKWLNIPVKGSEE